MPLQKVQATTNIEDDNGNTEKVVTEVEYDFGGTLDEAVDIFTAPVVFNLFKQQATVALQAYIRRLVTPKKDEEGNLEDPPTEETIQEAVSAWKPGLAVSKKKSKVDKVRDMLKGLSPEDLAALAEETGLAELLGSGEEDEEDIDQEAY